MMGCAGLVFGQIGRRQSGVGVLLDEFLQQRRHAEGAGDRAARAKWTAFSGARGLGHFCFYPGERAAEDGAGFGIGQMDLTQIPGSRPHTELVGNGGSGKGPQNEYPSD